MNQTILTILLKRKFKKKMSMVTNDFKELEMIIIKYYLKKYIYVSNHNTVGNRIILSAQFSRNLFDFNRSLLQITKWPPFFVDVPSHPIIDDD